MLLHDRKPTMSDSPALEGILRKFNPAPSFSDIATPEMRPSGPDTSPTASFLDTPRRASDRPASTAPARCPARVRGFRRQNVGQRARSLDLLIAPIVVIAVAVIDSPPLVDKPAINAGIPRVGLIALILFGLCVRNQLWLIEPPDRAFSIPRDRLRPQLVAVIAKGSRDRSSRIAPAKSGGCRSRRADRFRD